MRHCENPECPHLLSRGFHSECVDAQSHCPDCGTLLVAGPSPSVKPRLRAPGNGIVSTRFSFALRLLAVLAGGWLVAAVAPVLNLWLSLPAAPEEFILRPYSLLTYWLLSPSLENLAQTALGLVAYGSLLQPRLPASVLVRLAAISIVVAGLLYVVLPNSGLLVGALPIGAGFAGAVLRLWAGQRRDFAWWEHLLTAYAAFATSMLLVSAIAQLSNVLAAGTVAAGALYAHIVLGRAAAQQGAAADEPQRVPIDL